MACFPTPNLDYAAQKKNKTIIWNVQKFLLTIGFSLLHAPHHVLCTRIMIGFSLECFLA